jgi:hypothetical protein
VGFHHIYSFFKREVYSQILGQELYKMRPIEKMGEGRTILKRL